LQFAAWLCSRDARWAHDTTQNAYWQATAKAKRILDCEQPTANRQQEMKRIEAFIRVNKLESVKQALEDAGIYGISCEQVRGYGRQFGRTDKYRGSTYAVNLLPKMKVEVVVKDEDLEEGLAAIVAVAQTGEIGDGKIFVSDVMEAVRIRTGERGDAALS
jgi:nitrogen regulatory protein P-II 1